MITDLTESDFVQELNIEERVKNLDCLSDFFPNMNKINMKLSIKSKNCINHTKSLKIKRLTSILFVGYLVQKFINKLKIAIDSTQTDNKNLTKRKKKSVLINDPSFFLEGLSALKRKKTSKTRNSLNNMLIYFEKSYLFKVFMKMLRKIPILEDFSIICNIWDTLQFILILILTIYIPLKIFLYDNIQDNTKFYENYLLLTCQIAFFIDILLKFNTSFFKNGMSIINRKEIAIHYLKYNFLKDLLGFISITFCNLSNYFLFFFLFKLIKIKEFLSNVEINHFTHIISKIYFNFFLNLILIAIIAHYMACLWYFIGFYGLSNGNESWLNTWNIYKSGLLLKYFYSYYFSFEMIILQENSVISPTNQYEVIFSFGYRVISVFIFFYIASRLGFLIVQNFENKKESDEILMELNQFLKKNKISQKRQIKLRNFLKDSLKNRNNEKILLKQKELIDNMPENLRGELFEEAIEPLIYKIPAISSNFSLQSVKKLRSSFHKLKFAPNQTIFNEGDSDDKSLYLILKGYSSISLPLQETSLQMRKKLDIIGALSFFSNLPRSYTVKALSKITVLKLTQEDFLKVLRENPEDYEKFCEIKDKIRLERNLEDLKISCKCCNFPNHDEIYCPLNHYLANRTRIIQTYSYDENQRSRKKFKRPITKHRRIKYIASETLKGVEKEDLSELYLDDDFDENSDNKINIIERKNTIISSNSINIDALGHCKNYLIHNNYERILFEYNNRIKKKLYRLLKSDKMTMSSQKVLSSFKEN